MFKKKWNKIIKINQKFELFSKYIDNKAEWKVQLGMSLKMCNNRGQKGCLKSYWYSFSLTIQIFSFLGSKLIIYSLFIQFDYEIEMPIFD